MTGKYVPADDDINTAVELIDTILSMLPDSKKTKACTTVCAWLFESYVSQKSPMVGQMMLNDLRKIAAKYSVQQPGQMTIQ